jgi:hypothetical protein
MGVIVRCILIDERSAASDVNIGGPTYWSKTFFISHACTVVQCTVRTTSYKYLWEHATFGAVKFKPLHRGLITSAESPNVIGLIEIHSLGGRLENT